MLKVCSAPSAAGTGGSDSFKLIGISIENFMVGVYVVYAWAHSAEVQRTSQTAGQHRSFITMLVLRRLDYSFVTCWKTEKLTLERIL